jgi:thiol-disulfide isomerase/thioredoxin
MVFCIYCGAESAAGVNFCSKCGKQIQPGADGESGSPPKAEATSIRTGAVASSPRRPWRVLGSFALVVAVLGVVSWALTRGDQESTSPSTIPTTTTEAADGTDSTAGAPATTAEPEIVPVMAVGAALPRQPSTGTDPAVGLTVPALSGPGPSGEEVSVDADGQPRLLVVMAHWCPHCQAALPRLVSLVDQDGYVDGVEVVVIASSTTSARSNYPPEAWLQREEWPGRAILDGENSSLATALGLTAFPTWIAVDEGGRVVARDIGEIDSDGITALAVAARRLPAAAGQQTADSPQTVSSVAERVATTGFHLGGVVSIDDDQAADLVAYARSSGYDFYLVVLDDSPAGGNTVFAEAVLDALRVDSGTVLVLSREDVGWVTDGEGLTATDLEEAYEMANNVGGDDAAFVSTFLTSLLG